MSHVVEYIIENFFIVSRIENIALKSLVYLYVDYMVFDWLLTRVLRCSIKGDPLSCKGQILLLSTLG